MPAALTPHRTPLRRLSQGSLSRLSRSGAYPDAPHGLGFLEPALAVLVEETEALLANADGLRRLEESLDLFNESFASWLYVMNMNALTTDWPQAPTDASFILAARRAEEDARAAAEALAAAQAPKSPPPPSLPDQSLADRTILTTEAPSVASHDVTAASASSKTVPPAKKKGARPKLTVKEKRERGILIEKVTSALPLEFRGNDPNLRRHIETVTETFLDNAGRGIGILEFIKPPDLNQARANKCLIALVNRKIVQKENSTGSVLYHWHGLPG